MLLWELNPKKRNTNNKVTLYSDNEIEAGDVIISNPADTNVSTYTVTEVLEKRPAKLKGKTHYTVLTSWCFNGLPFFKGLNLEGTSKSFQKQINGL
ncbi:hypothetical protein B0A75_04600 [Flavobacterium oncorhynchi]|uniref:Uncharacterized protein n=1 Tax=Flavobacterium oncorhynchi TaxID=728056 RepID=A0A226I5W4_9FLAO|nr:hypothetical protein [Flavobacterium oncorhynchi]OXB01725.1 hypothetical protein B0A75_04600 [Flavobacterium oncorhynchi]